MVQSRTKVNLQSPFAGRLDRGSMDLYPDLANQALKFPPGLARIAAFLMQVSLAMFPVQPIGMPRQSGRIDNLDMK